MFLRQALPVVFVLVIGCGGGSDPVQPSSPTSPTPPPPGTNNQPGPPVALVLQTGDGQTGEPGFPVAVKPSVLVKDSAGRPVPNAPVTFVVDSGGGNIAGAQAVSNTNGIAISGEWVLGPLEGRNTLRVSATGVQALKLGATATYSGVTVTAGTVATSGGNLVVSRPGTALDGFQIAVPAAAFPGPVVFSVSIASSAGITLGSGATSAVRATGSSSAAGDLVAVTPVITVTSNGPATANGEVQFKIPLPRNTGTDIVVAVVDSLGRPLAFLQVLSMDSTSATVTTRGLDLAVYALVTPLPSTGARRLSVVVFRLSNAGTELTLAQMLPNAFISSYRFGKNDFEFNDMPTALSDDIGTGMALAEWGGQWTYPTGINAVYQLAKGVPESNVRGIKLAAGLSADFARGFGAFGPGWIASYYPPSERTRSDRWTVSTIYYHLITRGPVPVLLTDGVKYRMVLVTAWVPSTQSFSVRDPAKAEPQFLHFANSVMQPYTDPLNPLVTYTIPYYAASSAYGMWPKIQAGLVSLYSTLPEPYATVWPLASYESWDQIVRGANRNVPDSLFMVNDTTRIWPTAYQPPSAAETTLPIPAGWGSEPARVFWRSEIADAWFYEPNLGGHDLPLDFRFNITLNGGSEAKTMGLVISRYTDNADLSGSWLDWRQIDIVKYGISFGDIISQPGLPVTLSPIKVGKLPLPTTAVYEWNFGDNTAPVRVVGPVDATHTYTAPGPYPLTLKVYHARTGQLIAKKQATARIGPLKWRLTEFVLESTSGTNLPQFSASTVQVIYQPTRNLLDSIAYDPRLTVFTYVEKDSLDPLGVVNTRGPTAVFFRTPTPSMVTPSTRTFTLLGAQAITPPPDAPGYVLDFTTSYVRTGGTANGSITGMAPYRWEGLQVPDAMQHLLSGGELDMVIQGNEISGHLTYLVRQWSGNPRSKTGERREVYRFKGKVDQ